MAAIKDVPQVVRKLGFKSFAKKVWQGVSEDGVFNWASAMAYAWVFAIFPMVLAVLTLVPYLPWQTKEKAQKTIGEAVYTSMGGEAADTIMASVEDIMHNSKGGLLSLGLVLAIYSASGGMAMTMSALDKAYKVKSERSFIKQKLVAIGLTVAAMILILAVLFLLPIGGAIADYLKNYGFVSDVAKVVIDILRYVLALAMLFGIVSLTYYFGPHIKQKWQAVTPGAIVTVVIWLAMGIGFGIYVQNFGNFNKTYGALGAAIILLLFSYLSSAILLVGAEVNSVIDFVALGVEPGCRDFSQAPCKDAAKNSFSPVHGGEAAEAREQIDKGGRGRRGKAFPPVVAPTGWWKWAAASFAGGWAAKKIAGVPDSRHRVP
jgi:membrane protein